MIFINNSPPYDLLVILWNYGGRKPSTSYKVFYEKKVS